MAKHLETAQIVTCHGRAFIIETSDGKRLSCSVRGKKTDLACGDQVEIQRLNHEQAVIERTLPRRSLLYRADDWRSKLIAANVSLVVIVLAPFPSFSEDFLGRCLVACEAAGIETLIVLNKCDLPNIDDARASLKLYETLGYRLLELSAKQSIEPLKPWLQRQTTVLIGQSGMGKSTIINALLPNANVRTGEISLALDSGKHTTTHASLYHLDADSHIIDSPGMQEFGLKQVKADALDVHFPELRPYIGQCRFNNCRHLSEPGCAVKQGVEEGQVAERRHALYRRLAMELAS